MTRIWRAWLLGITILLAVSCAAVAQIPASTIIQRLGYAPDSRLLIIHSDDLGMSHSVNMAVFQALQKGWISSASIMVPCPWFPEIAGYAKEHPDKDFGVHLCHTAEWTRFRWGPVAPRKEVRGLIDPEGYLWRGVEQVYANATPEQALAEGRAQIKRALVDGDYVILRESKKRPKGWKPHAERPENIKKAEGKKK